MAKYIIFIVAAIVIASCADKNPQATPVENNTSVSGYDTVVNKSSNFEQVVTNVIKAFKNKDIVLANDLVSPDHGVIILYRTGVFNEYKELNKIDFNNPVPQNFPFPSTVTDYRLKYEDLPKFNCGIMKWDKHGLYCDTIRKDTLLSGTPQNLIKYRGDKIAQNEVDKLKALESKSRRVVLAHPDNDFVFYLTLINRKWYLTAIDRITTDCSA